MGIISTAIQRRNQLPLTDATPWRLAGIIRASAAGPAVNAETSLTYSAVFRAVDLLSNHFAMLPCGIYERLDDRSRRRAYSHPLDTLLHNAPNWRMTSFNWRKAAMAHLLLWGNHYSQIETDAAGRVVALWPLLPGGVQRIFEKDGIWFYRYQDTTGKITDIPHWQIFHWRGFTFDGFLGIGVISLARESIGLGLAAQRFGARFFANDARPSVVLRHPGILGDLAYKNMRESWEAAHSGGNSWGFAILEEGTEIQTMTMPPEDAQFLETRRFEVSEIARWFGVPLHKLAELDRATFSNIEHQSIEYVQDALQPHATGFEQAIASQLLTEKERERYYAKISFDALLRGDAESRHKVYQVGLGYGYLSINDVRKLEDMNPVPNGDDYRVPLNTAPADSLAAAGGEQERAAFRLDVEQRAKRSAQQRATLRNDYVPLFTEAIGRILRREANDVGNKAKTLLPKSGGRETLNAWLDGFYDEHREFIQRTLTPLAKSYSAQVVRYASDEVGVQVDNDRQNNFIEAYLKTYAVRHTARQRKRIDDVLVFDDALERLDAEMELWRSESRASGMGEEEATRMNGAVSIMVYGAAGIMIKRWLAFGDSCPYCAALNGQTVSLTMNFLEAGQEWMPPGADSPLTINYNIGHPPAHGGCDCMIVAG